MRMTSRRVTKTEQDLSDEFLVYRTKKRNLPAFSHNEKVTSNPKIAAAGKCLMQKTKRNFRRVDESSSTHKKLDERLEKVQKRESDFVASCTQEVVTMALFLVAKSEVFAEERKNKELDHSES